MKWSGIYTALITPFDAQGALDEEGLCFLIQRQKNAGVDGIVVLGTTGEAPTLTDQEKERIIRLAAQEKGNLLLMVGCGAYSTTQVLENIQTASRLGADAALVVTPFYNKPTQQGVFIHFQTVCQSSPIPVCIYNHPGRTGVNIELEVLQKLAEIPNVLGIKETAGSIPQFADILYSVKKQRPHFAVLSGDDNLAFPVKALGGDGVISAASNLFPETMVALLEACDKGNYEQAQKINLALTPLFKGLALESNPIPLKAALNMCGLPGGKPRLPLTPLSKKYENQLRQTLSLMLGIEEKEASILCYESR
jgi:4-hydroxy-tetrahydrodipicolinate synthase